MISKIYDVFVKTAVIILLVSGLWLVLEACYKKSKGHFEFGSLMDVFSASCNVAMAGAALYAAHSAKKWFEQKQQLNTLDAANKLSLEFEELLWKINERLYTDTLFRASVKSNITNKTLVDEEIIELINIEIERMTSTDLIELARIYTGVTKLKRYNVIVSKELLVLIDEIKDARGKYLESHYSYLGELAYNMTNIEVSNVKKAEELVISNQLALGTIFQIKLCDQHINLDYPHYSTK